MQEKWMLRAKKADFFALSEKYGVDPVIIRLLVNRGVKEEEMGRYLNPTLSQLHDPHLLKDSDKAAEILEDEIKKGTHIRIIGDYDVDGVNSTYILYRCLENAGASVSYAIPHRANDGYGINIRLIDQAKEEGAGLIITCDNGIAASGEIAHAKSLGLKVIVTDHHEVPFEENGGKRCEILPPADAIVNPKQALCPYPFKGICGAVVAHKLMYVLYERMNLDKAFVDEFIENAGFATVGDVMDLVDENRAIVKEGLSSINKTTNPGLSALIRLSGIKKVECYHLGFVIGPCFNASGRLESAHLAMELLLADEGSAAEKAANLIALNEERKALTESGVSEAIRLAEKEYSLDKVLVIHLPNVHESIAGIIAGRLKERLYKPSFVVAGDGDIIKGSGRSIEAYSMYEEMNKVSDVFTRFGGHPMAAGFSLEKNRLSEMRERMNKECTLTEEDLIPKKYIDMAMPLSYITEKLIGELSLLEPMGKGNEKPVFAEKEVTFLSARRIGKEKNMLRLTLEDASGKRYTAMYFSDADEFLSSLDEKFGSGAGDNVLRGRGSYILPFTYYPQINEYNGTRSIQLVITGVLW